MLTLRLPRCAERPYLFPNTRCPSPDFGDATWSPALRDSSLRCEASQSPVTGVSGRSRLEGLSRRVNVHTGRAELDSRRVNVHTGRAELDSRRVNVHTGRAE